MAIRDGRIVALGQLAGAVARSEVDATGLHVLPGAIDSQVHLREPGFEHKEDLETGTKAAVLGGVTSVFDMPNSTPTTTNLAAFEDKLQRSKGRVHCDIAFYVGATPDNIDELSNLELSSGCCGVKVFMGKSTGDLLVADDRELRRVLLAGRRRVAIHAEDEQRLRERKSVLAENPHVGMHPVWRDTATALRATERVVRLAEQVGRRVHILHVTTADEMEFLGQHKTLATVECTPQHLTLAAPECYERLGTLAQMNPPIRSAEHRDALWEAVRSGVVDVVGSDHAPHTLAEKKGDYPNTPSGMTGVQTLVPLLLEHVHQGRLSLELMVDLVSAGPARVFGIAGKGRIAVGFDADLTLVDLKREQEIRNDWIASRCGWTPFDGYKVHGWPVATFVRGVEVMRDGDVLVAPGGRPVQFLDALSKLRVVD